MAQAKGGRSGAQEEPPPEPEAGGSSSGEAAGGEAPPASGHGHECLEWCPVCRSAELLKGINSPEVRQQLQSIQSEAMQVVKAFAAAYAERTADDSSGHRRDDRGPGEGAGAERPKPAETPIDISIE